MERLIGLAGAVPGGFGQAGDDRIPRVIIGGGIGDECGHGQVSAIGKSDNADVVSRGGDAVLSAAGAGLVRDHGPSGQFSFGSKSGSELTIDTRRFDFQKSASCASYSRS